MPLFTTDDAANYRTGGPALPQSQRAGVCAVAEQPGHTHTIIGRVSDTIPDVWPLLSHSHNYHYASAGLWSVHELLFHFLQQTGPADVTIATWSVTEDAVRMLVKGLESGLLRSMRLLIDARVIRRNASAYAFVKAHADLVRITACHAKVTVIQNADWDITLNGSPNYTNNPRIESGVVTESRLVAAFHRGWITDEMSKLKPFGL